MSITICHVNADDPSHYARESAAFTAAGAVLRFSDSLTPDALRENAQDADVILFTATRFDEAAFSALPNLKLLVRYGIGYDNVDLEAAKRHNVIVCNCPSYGAYDVAEHAFALLQAANRKIASYDRQIRTGGADADYPCRRLAGKQIGFVGYGRIARHMAQFAAGFGMTVAACDPYADVSKADPPAAPMPLEDLLRTSDYVSLNTALTEETRGLMSAERFAMMKPDAILVNTSRGGLIDDDALFDALSQGRLRAAGIDVWNTIPDSTSRFCTLDNIVMTPHMAWNTTEAAAALTEEVITTVLRWIGGEALPNRLWR